MKEKELVVDRIPTLVDDRTIAVQIGPVEFDVGRARKMAGYTLEDCRILWAAIAGAVDGIQRAIALRHGRAGICPACEQYTPLMQPCIHCEGDVYVAYPDPEKL